MKDVLQKIKKAYIQKQGYIGICGAAYLLFSDEEITSSEFTHFRQLIEETASRRIFFYTFGNVITSDATQFLWQLEDIQSRLNWLDERINKQN